MSRRTIVQWWRALALVAPLPLSLALQPCRPSTSSASGADDDTITTDTMATSSTDSEALSLLEKLRVPSKKKVKKLRSCLFM